MKKHAPLCLRPILASLCTALLVGSSVRAQIAGTDPLLLAKYDTNKNGRLDPEEIAAMAAAQRTPAGAETGHGGETVLLSPFEVVAQDRGYYASSTMSGTRLNSKVEDLASSITVILPSRSNTVGVSLWRASRVRSALLFGE